MPGDWVHRKPGSSLPQLPHGYPTNTDMVTMGVHHERYLAYKKYKGEPHTLVAQMQKYLCPMFQQESCLHQGI